MCLQVHHIWLCGHSIDGQPPQWDPPSAEECVTAFLADRRDKDGNVMHCYQGLPHTAFSEYHGYCKGLTNSTQCRRKAFGKAGWICCRCKKQIAADSLECRDCQHWDCYKCTIQPASS